MDVNSETIELIERRLSEKVEVQVRDRLFKFYRTIWAIAAVVLTFFGYNVIANLNKTAESYAQDAVKPSVASANAAAGAASDQVNKITARLEAIDDYLQRREEKMIENEGRVIESQAKVQSASAEMDQRLKAMLDQIGETEAQLKATQQRIADTAGAGNVEQLRANLEVVAEQVSHIAAAVQSLDAGAGAAEEPVASMVDPRQIATVVSTLKQVATEPAGGIVYFQFAGVDRKVAAGISAALEAEGFTMPGAERTETAARLHEVRYFFEGDRGLAERLVADVNRVLAAQGFRNDVTARSLVSYSKSKPREGTIELWLEPIPLGS